jgi:hypothetical protein
MVTVAVLASSVPPHENDVQTSDFMQPKRQADACLKVREPVIDTLLCTLQCCELASFWQVVIAYVFGL